MEIVIRASAVFFLLWLLLRALGKRELAEMSAFELVLVVVLGDVVQQGITQEDMSVTGAALAAGTIGLWILGFSFLSFRSKRAREMLEGAPTVVIRHGRVYREALHVERIATDELRSAARLAGIHDLGEIEIGLIEADGRFSFIRKDQADQGKGETAAPEGHEL